MPVRTFGDDLRHFARSLDILDKDLCNQVTEVVRQYLERTLSVQYVEIAVPAFVNEEPGIETAYSSTNERHSTSLRNGGGAFRSQLALSFSEGIPLWVVSADGGPLRSAGAYRNLWRDPHLPDVSDELPPYRPPNGGEPIRTSIMLPAKLGGRTIAALDLESTAALEITEDAKRELLRLAEAIAHLRDCCSFNESRTDGTRSALETLKDTARSGAKLQLAKPAVFFAFPGNTDRDVVAAVNEVLESFSEHLNVTRWDQIDRAGNITRHISDAISNARFGICYFSEYAPEDRKQFRDNPNVLFEAGMLHALSEGNVQAGWIPIREPNSPDAPFDVLQQRTLPVERYADGKLNKPEFQDNLRRRIHSLLGN